MKQHLLTLSCLLLLPLGAFGQGDLTPPGPPGPTMKSLDQVDGKLDQANSKLDQVEAKQTAADAKAEKRTPISTLPFTITSPGSYYLTGNLTGTAGQSGITVAADAVTIDLNGFSLVGVAGSSSGIATSGERRNLAIRNGAIRGWGGAGIFAGNVINGQLEKLRVSNNAGFGIFLSASISASPAGTVAGTVKDCVVDANGTTGLSGQGLAVRDCTATNNGAFGFFLRHCTVEGCTALANGSTGIFASGFSTVRGCVANENGKEGISVVIGIVTHCLASTNVSHGIRANFRCTVLSNNCDGNGTGADPGAGIHVEGNGSRIEGNNTAENDIGIRVVGGGNLIIRNSSRGGTDAYDIGNGNSMGKETNVFNPSTTTIIDDPNSWANFLY